MRKITLKVDGMMCGMCESHVNDAIRRGFAVKKVTSSHSKGETVILCDADILEADLSKALEGSGYKVLSSKTEAYEKKGFMGLFSK